MGEAQVGGPQFARARAIVGECFANPRALRALRLQGHPLFEKDFPLEAFFRVLAEIFTGG